MSSTRKAKVHKAIFQISISPQLTFYNTLFNKTTLHDYFPDWKTDSLSVELKDYKKRHSLKISFDSYAYETDNYKQSELINVVKLIVGDGTAFANQLKTTRLGYRFQTLTDVDDISFSDLVEILNLKLINPEVFDVVKKPTDNTVTLILNIAEKIICRIMIGPMKKAEIGNFITLNTNNHFYKSDKNRLKDITEVFDSYPSVSVFMDMDFFTTSEYNVEDFFTKVNEEYENLTATLHKYIFQDKVQS